MSLTDPSGLLPDYGKLVGCDSDAYNCAGGAGVGDMGSPTYYLNGLQSSAGTVQWLLSIGAAGLCRGNNCGPVVGSNGFFYSISLDQEGWSYINTLNGVVFSNGTEFGLPALPDDTTLDYSIGGGLPGGGGTDQCANKILGRFNAQFGNPPAAAVADIGRKGLGGVTINILVGFGLSTLPAGQVYTGHFGGGTFGTGSTLHVVSFYVGTMPGDLTGTLLDIARAHLDQGNPLIPPLGTLSHLGYVLTHSAGACP